MLASVHDYTELVLDLLQIYVATHKRCRYESILLIGTGTRLPVSIGYLLPGYTR